VLKRRDTGAIAATSFSTLQRPWGKLLLFLPEMKIPRIRAVEPKTSTAEWTALPGGRGFRKGASAGT